MRIAIIGTGVSGLSAAWLLSRSHDVTVYEKDDTPGGHANTVDVDVPEAGPISVDTGFIVYNTRNYPNLVALFDHFDIPTQATAMSFSVSVDDGGFEYSGSGLNGLLAQRRNVFRPRLWSMVRDLRRFYAEAPDILSRNGLADRTLGDLLRDGGYGDAFVEDHILPMGAAIWSTPKRRMLDYPAAAFVAFLENHGLLQFRDRPQWRTVVGGSREYVRRLTAPFADRIRVNTAVEAVTRTSGGVTVEDRQGGVESYDQVVFATHADQALAALTDADEAERKILSAFRYQRNLAVLHGDRSLMPKTRRAWACWNYLSRSGSRDGAEGDDLCVTYWMNALQHLPTRAPLLVTLNPTHPPAQEKIHRSFLYEHPLYDPAADRMQSMIWNIQGQRRTWFCGSYLGYGFHEDGLQAGLAVAEMLGGATRPWRLDDPSDRLRLPATSKPSARDAAE